MSIKHLNIKKDKNKNNLDSLTSSTDLRPNCTSRVYSAAELNDNPSNYQFNIASAIKKSNDDPYKLRFNSKVQISDSAIGYEGIPGFDRHQNYTVFGQQMAGPSL